MFPQLTYGNNLKKPRHAAPTGRSCTKILALEQGQRDMKDVLQWLCWRPTSGILYAEAPQLHIESLRLSMRSALWLYGER